MSIPLPLPLLADDIAGKIGLHKWTIGPNPKPGALISSILHGDTVVSTLVVMVVLIGMALYLRPRITTGVPGGLQNLLEIMIGFIVSTANDLIGEARARVIAPLAVTLGFFIALSNLLGLIPNPFELHSPTADMNTTFALSAIVILYVHYSSVRARGIGKYLKGWLNPITIIEEIPKPVTLSLRLFGNIAAGEILLVLLGALPLVLISSPLPTVVWVSFSVFIGLVQAFVFMMLTIAYYGIGTDTGGH